MKTVTETATLNPSEYGSLEGLIARLNQIRANTNAHINVSMSGSADFGFKLQLTWERNMTDDEFARYQASLARAEEAAKELRRAEYEKLKKEFDPK